MNVKSNKEYIVIDEKYEKILSIVKAQPGVQPSIITRTTGINKDTVHYRLSNLQRANLVQVIRAQHIIKVYPAGYSLERDVSLKQLSDSASHAESAGAGN